MRIWVLEIGEPLPLETNVRLHRYGQFTKWLAKQGHEVTWWTTSFSHAPKTNVVNETCDRVVDGVNLRFMFSEGYKRNVSLARIRHNKNFATFFKMRATRYPRPDLIVAPIPIIEAAYEAVSFGVQYGIPVIVDIRDLWPDELVDLAPKRLRPFSKFLLQRAFGQMRFVCTNATGIVGVSQSYVDYGLQFANRKQESTDAVFPLGYAGETTTPTPLPFRLREDSFKICFFGTLGRFFNIEAVIEAARILEKEFPVDFVIAGDGSQLDHYRKLAGSTLNVIFPGWLNAGQIASVMNISQAGIAPYKADAKMSLPNKPFEYMAGGLPIISSIQGELKRYLEEYNCGLTYNANSAQELASCIRLLKNNPDLCEQMKSNSRDLLNSHFSLEKVFASAGAHLATVVIAAKGAPVRANFSEPTPTFDIR